MENTARKLALSSHWKVEDSLELYGVEAWGNGYGISQSHVAKILALLKRSGYVASTRGQIGGYTLSRSASEMLLKDVLSELGGKIYRQDFCDRFTGHEKVCVHDADCSILPLWMSIQKAIDVALNGLTLQDLLEPSAGINVKLFNEGNARSSAC